MEVRVILALLAGIFSGGAYVFWCFRHGLTARELDYFRSFLDALRCGEYDELPNDERSDENE